MNLKKFFSYNFYFDYVDVKKTDYFDVVVLILAYIPFVNMDIGNSTSVSKEIIPEIGYVWIMLTSLMICFIISHKAKELNFAVKFLTTWVLGNLMVYPVMILTFPLEFILSFLPDSYWLKVHRSDISLLLIDFFIPLFMLYAFADRYWSKKKVILSKR